MLGMKQGKLATLADVETRHIYNIEKGLVEPKLRIIIVFSDILGLDLNELKQYATHDADGIYWKIFDTSSVCIRAGFTFGRQSSTHTTIFLSFYQILLY